MDRIFEVRTCAGAVPPVPCGGPALITYAYDDAATNGKGRLRSIARGASTTLYTYDALGRQLLDGELSFTYDKNGNQTTIAYPGGVTATYGFDAADRQRTLVLTPGNVNVVTDALYGASGPLRVLSLANGRTETRTYDTRYFPTGIAVSDTSGLSWTYSYDDGSGSFDDVGNVKCILGTPHPKSFSYQERSSRL